MSHTAGPWEMTPDGILLALSRRERMALGVFKGFASDEQHVAEHPSNCQLIAAAPDLLHALRELVHAIVEQPDSMSGVLISRAESAIAKAEGK